MLERWLVEQLAKCRLSACSTRCSLRLGNISRHCFSSLLVAESNLLELCFAELAIFEDVPILLVVSL